mmetsp:Transcript_45580/g.110946  ORF Transcript_45580/g.110946 Transcript_45580/m.110946 type:complete len:353 (-) Transcript_45580:1640-2698(-)|eukprot:CAMPEP_0113459992 /NCGR_PEP_ID=MMETSP0014_2-20120614/10752_1 /TAXON_ID=2857 /ORGANISM="Nitzschia sp." /LENGTH=352 /DNA_ID=CAMNT_0000351621 /DNA_START=244 /DNA_END=1302 /DNA_ORIENTATION=- /assembly_acc=CAM_ASM_000159
MPRTPPATTITKQEKNKEPTAVGPPAAGPPDPYLPSVVRDHSDSTTSSISQEEGEDEDQGIAVLTNIDRKKKKMGATTAGGNENENERQQQYHSQNGSTNDGKRRVSLSNNTPPSSPGRLSPRGRRSPRRRTTIDLSEYLECSLSSPSYDNDDEEDDIRNRNHENNTINRSFRDDDNQKIYLRILIFLTSISVSDVVDKITRVHYFWTSPVLLRIYTAVLVAITIRQYWVLQTISVMIVLRMVALLTEWGLFAWHAPNFQRVKSMVLWWVNFGLGLATKSASDGPSIHRLVTSVSVTVAKGVGKDMTLGAIKGIANNNRQNVVTRAKENMKLVNDRTQKMKRTFGGSMSSPN